MPLVITGCWDRIEINDIGFVMGTGLDLMKDGNIRATLQISVPSPSSQTDRGRLERYGQVLSDFSSWKKYDGS